MSINSAKTGSTGLSLALDNNFMEPIASILVGSGGSNTIIFNDIPQTYKHLQLRALVRGGSETGVNASYNGSGGTNHALYGRGTTNTVGSFPDSIMTIGVTPDSANNAAAFAAFVADILDYTNTNKFKTTRSLAGVEITGSGNSYLFFLSGLWQSTNAISSISLSLTSGIFSQNTRVSLYGIKG